MHSVSMTTLEKDEHQKSEKEVREIDPLFSTQFALPSLCMVV